MDGGRSPSTPVRNRPRPMCACPFPIGGDAPNRFPAVVRRTGPSFFRLRKIAGGSGKKPYRSRRNGMMFFVRISGCRQRHCTCLFWKKSMFLQAFVSHGDKKIIGSDKTDNRERRCPNKTAQQHGNDGFLPQFAELGKLFSQTGL